MQQSIPIVNTPSPGKPWGIFGVVKSPALEQNFYAKAWAWAEKVPTLGNILEDLVSLSC